MKDETIFLRAHGIGEVVTDIQKSRFSRVLIAYSMQTDGYLSVDRCSVRLDFTTALFI